ncbi:MAG: FAD-binding oxidoreductase, partial [Candidatus Freyarchaeota archaeon]
EALQKIVGKNYVSDRPEERYYYSSDPSAEEPCTPEFVVLPGSVEEIQEILRLANREKIPVTPRTGGLTLSGLAIPYGGGILLDLKRMNRILEVNEDSMYAVIECGVTTGQLKTYLEENHPDLWFCQPHSPPSVGVASNAIIHGTGQVSLKYGTSSDMVNGLEIVLPTGEILRTGSCALGRSWATKYCLPDFTGLFLGWFGATGIITKASIQLWPKPKVRDTLFYKIDRVDNLVDVLLRFARGGVCEDICVYSWTGTSGRERFGLPEKPKGVPEVTMDVLLGGSSREELELKRRIVRGIAEELSMEGVRVEEYNRPSHIRSSVLMVPRVYPFMDLVEGGGAEYFGCYVPTEVVDAAYCAGVEAARRHGFQYLHFVRPLRGGHVTVVMYIFPFDRRDSVKCSKLLRVLEELCEAALELGGVPWKLPPRLQRVVLEHANFEYVKLMKKIKGLLDPNGVMAPGQWAF